MAIRGKCPHCREVLDLARVELIQFAMSPNAKEQGVSYSCNKCDTVLTVSFNLVTLQNELLQRIEDPSAGPIR